MITVNVGGLPVCIDGSKLHAMIGEQLSHAFDYNGMAPRKARVVKLGMKMLMREALGTIERGIIRGQLAYPMPDRDAMDADVLTYGASYLMAMLLADLEHMQFEAEYTEGPNGEIIISRIVPATASLPADSAIAGFLASPDDSGEIDAAPGAVDATGHADTPAALSDPATGEPGGASGDRGASGRYVDAGGDEGDRQDDGVIAPDARALAPLA